MGVPACQTLPAAVVQDPARQLPWQAAEISPIDGLIDRLGAQPAVGLARICQA